MVVYLNLQQTRIEKHLAEGWVRAQHSQLRQCLVVGLNFWAAIDGITLQQSRHVHRQQLQRLGQNQLA